MKYLLPLLLCTTLTSQAMTNSPELSPESDSAHQQNTEQYKKEVSELKTKIKSRDRELLHHVEPVWPKNALADKVNGSVTMSFSIGIDGRVSNIVVTEASPAGVFDQAAITALSQWRYGNLAKPLSNILTRFDFEL